MNPLRCQILVVGAGPAGSSAARAAAGKGAHVVVVERKKNIGTPVRCAEYIPAPLPGIVNLGLDYKVQAIKGMRTHLPDGSVSELKAPGFTINRDVFDQTLAAGAEKAGADISLSSSAVKYEEKKVAVKGEQYTYEILPDIIIGADGPHSIVGGWIDSENAELIPAVQARVLLKKPLDFTEVHFHQDFFGGYGWLFPKGTKANVGLGMKFPDHGRSLLGKRLEAFIAQLVKEEKIYPQVLERFGGWIPAGPVRKVVKNNILLVGDAAGQIHPITGAGIAPAVICGEMAGRWAAEAVRKGDITMLSGYQEEWEDMFGETINLAFKRRRLMEAEWHSLDTIIRKCWVVFREYYAGT